MSRKISLRIISQIPDFLFGRGNIFAWFIPAGRLYEAALILDSRQTVGRGTAKSLHQPVARNGITKCSRRKAGAGNKNSLSVFGI